MKVQTLLFPDAISRVQNALKYVCSQGLTQTLWGTLNSTSPDSLAALKGTSKGRGRKGRGGIPQSKSLTTTPLQILHFQLHYYSKANDHPCKF